MELRQYTHGVLRLVVFSALATDRAVTHSAAQMKHATGSKYQFRAMEFSDAVLRKVFDLEKVGTAQATQALEDAWYWHCNRCSSLSNYNRTKKADIIRHLLEV